MVNIRANRLAEQIKKERGDIVKQKLKDPRGGFDTITDVKITNDLQQAKVFVSIFGDEEEKNDSLMGLTKATGFMRTEVGRRIRLRKVPEITFEYDEALEYGRRIDSILRELNKDE